jgi:16S rRNA (guanine966-N2)-methyltransferase
VRIVGGAFRGRRLKAPAGGATRPTSEKVREALFDILGERIRGALLVDLFAGTGAVGFEAVSRGAARAVLVERRGATLRALRENQESLGLGRDSVRVIAADAAKALAILKAEGEPPAVVFCDPPYSDASWPLLLARMGQALPWEEGGLLVVEHASRNPPACPEGFRLRKAYRYGDTGVTVFERSDRVIE